MANNKTWYVVRLEDRATLSSAKTEEESLRMALFFDDGGKKARVYVTNNPGKVFDARHDVVPWRVVPKKERVPALPRRPRKETVLDGPARRRRSV